MGRRLRKSIVERLKRIAPWSLCALLIGCSAADTTKAARPEATEDVHVESSLTACPSFAYHLVLPRDIRSGEVATVYAFATDADSDDAMLRYAWEATSGDFTEPASALTRYTCSASGPQVLSVTTWDPDGCESHLDLDVTCLAP